MTAARRPHRSGPPPQRVHAGRGARARWPRRGRPGERIAIARIDMSAHDGLHPRVGALDVAPIVYLEHGARGAACAEALVLGDLLGERARASRASLRRPGRWAHPRRACAAGARGARPPDRRRRVTPDFGPQSLDSAGGARCWWRRGPRWSRSMSSSRPGDARDARADSGADPGGRARRPARRPGDRPLASQRAVRRPGSTNIDDYSQTSPARGHGGDRAPAPVARPSSSGSPPRAAFDDFPMTIPVRNLRLSRTL